MYIYEVRKPAMQFIKGGKPTGIYPIGYVIAATNKNITLEFLGLNIPPKTFGNDDPDLKLLLDDADHIHDWQPTASPQRVACSICGISAGFAYFEKKLADNLDYPIFKKLMKYEFEKQQAKAMMNEKFGNSIVSDLAEAIGRPTVETVVHTLEFKSPKDIMKELNLSDYIGVSKKFLK